MIKNLEQYPIIRDIEQTITSLIEFEDLIVKHWEEGKIKGPVHLSGGNEEQLIEIGKRMKSTDWVFSTWRSHYHALVKGISPVWLEEEILAGRSITIVSEKDKFYASAIVSSIIPIAVGAALGIKENGGDEKVWRFIGDMAFETGQFYEMHKYATNLDLPIIFIVEDNGVSTNTPTIETWGGTKREIPSNVIWYNYKNKWPHYGTGKWIIF
jgi:TPP-dependent pyruvate/acetoin dehydrogenase alpha subunit